MAQVLDQGPELRIELPGGRVRAAGRTFGSESSGAVAGDPGGETRVAGEEFGGSMTDWDDVEQVVYGHTQAAGQGQ